MARLNHTPTGSPPPPPTLGCGKDKSHAHGLHSPHTMGCGKAKSHAHAPPPPYTLGYGKSKSHAHAPPPYIEVMAGVRATFCAPPLAPPHRGTASERAISALTGSPPPPTHTWGLRQQYGLLSAPTGSPLTPAWGRAAPQGATAACRATTDQSHFHMYAHGSSPPRHSPFPTKRKTREAQANHARLSYCRFCDQR